MSRFTRHNGPAQHRPLHQRGAGFTLIEIMVALAIMMLLLVIVFVPLNLGIQIFNLGKTSSEVQQAANQTLALIEKDLQQAIFVYPNDLLPSVTDKSPWNGESPYFQDADQSDVINVQACNTAVFRSSNTARLDILLARSTNGLIVSPTAPENYIVTYYARRLYTSQDYDQYTNPIVLYRAQLAYQDANGAANMASSPSSAKNVEASSSRYPNPKPSVVGSPCLTNSANINRGSRWLCQNQYGEPNLEAIAGDDAGSGTTLVPGSHTLAIPRGMALVASGTDLALMKDASNNPIPDRRRAYIPDTSFTCADTNSDGKIDRVTINLVMGQFDAVGAQTKRQTVQYPLTVDLPNVR